MAKNRFFQQYTTPSEQNLVSSLYQESISIHGMSMYYIPRKIVTRDDTFRESVISEYDLIFETDCYLENFDSYEGEGTLLSRFGLEFRDQITVSFSAKSFREDVGKFLSHDRGPEPGDLIWFPLDKNLFQILNRSNRQTFFQLGGLYRHQVTCQLFEYNNENFNTGIPEIDNVYNSMTVLETYDDPIPSIDASILNDADRQAMNKHFEDEGDLLVGNFSANNPFGAF
jgi:hypothetical protein